MNEVISKYTAQLRYIPTLLLFSNLFNIASTLEGGDEFEKWSAKRGPDAALLYSTEKRTGIVVENNSIALNTEDANLGKDMFHPMVKYSTLFLEENKVEKFNHAGIRRIGIFDLSISYDKYVERFHQAFFNHESQLEKAIADTVKDTLYLVEGVKDGYEIRLKMAPLKQEQLKAHFPFDEFTPKDLELKKETSVLVDFDVYTSVENDFEGSLDNLENIQSIHSSTYENIVEILKKKTL